MTKELAYKQAGDCLIPGLEVEGVEGLEEMSLGKYGMLRETFLEKHHHGTYTSMLLTGRLYPHLREIDRQARKQVDRTVADLKKQNGVDDDVCCKGYITNNLETRPRLRYRG